MQSNTSKIILAIIITAVVVGGGVYYWQTQPSPGADLEKIIVSEKNELYRTYDRTSKELSSGYPVVFSNTTNPAVRFTLLTNSGGDAMHTTQYFINQAKQKILQVDTDEYGGDFGASGNLTLSLNGGSAIVISREQVVDDQKREIEFKGLRVKSDVMNSITFFDPIISKPTSALKFEVLGVNPDLTQIYFSDYSKKIFSYDIANDKIQEVTELPAMAKPITN